MVIHRTSASTGFHDADASKASFRHNRLEPLDTIGAKFTTNATRDTKEKPMGPDVRGSGVPGS
jgi:hypothetical protein